MVLFIFAILGLVYVQAVHFNLMRTESANAMISDQMALESAQYRMFLAAVNQVQASAPFIGSGMQTRDWSFFRQHAAAPSFVREMAHVPSTWRVRGNASDWIVCAPAHLQTLAPQLPVMPTGRTVATEGIETNLSKVLTQQRYTFISNQTADTARLNMCN